MTEIEKHFGCSNLLDVHKRLLQCHESAQRKNNLTKCDEYLLWKNHKFLWQDTPGELTWEEELAKKYYDKLFKEFCICDLSKYKENKVALRWRTKNEVISGKGQFTCAARECPEKEHLKTWEVNFCYIENKERKNALVKIKLCTECSIKLNYHSKKRQIARLDKKPKKLKSPKKNDDKKPKKSADKRDEINSPGPSSSNDLTKTDETPWTQHVEIDIKSREEEMDEYLNDLLF